LYSTLSHFDTEKL